MKHAKMPKESVIDWLKTNHPELQAAADRSWVWITSNLKPCKYGCECEGCKKKALTRKSIAAFGFVLAKSGHAMPGGKIAYWGHSCDLPMRFIRNKRGVVHARKEETPVRHEAKAELPTDADVDALLASL